MAGNADWNNPGDVPAIFNPPQSQQAEQPTAIGVAKQYALDLLAGIGLYEPADEQGNSATDLTASLMSTDIGVQEAATQQPTGIGTVGGQTHYPGQGAGEIGVVGYVAHAPAGSKAMLPSEQANAWIQAEADYTLAAQALEQEYQSNPAKTAAAIDDYNAKIGYINSQIELSRGQVAALRARYPAISASTPAGTAGTGQPLTKFQQAMQNALDSITGYKAVGQRGVVVLGGKQGTSSPVLAKPTPQVAMSIQPTSNNVTSIISKVTASVLLPKAGAGLALGQKTLAAPNFTQYNRSSSAQPGSVLAVKPVTAQQIAQVGNVAQPNFISASQRAASGASTQITSIIGSSPNGRPVAIPITTQAQRNITLAQSINPSYVARPVVSAQTESKANLAKTVATIQSSKSSTPARSSSGSNNSSSGNSSSGSAAVRVSTPAKTSTPARSSGSNNSSSGSSSSSSARSTPAPAASSAARSSAPAASSSSSASRGSGSTGSSGAVVVSGGVAYIGSVGKGK